MTRTAAATLPINETETKLFDAALTLFSQKGYEAASVREIIEAVGMTRPVLYYYCDSKEDLFKRLIHLKHDQAYRELKSLIRNTQGCEQQLKAIIRGSFEFCAADVRVPRLMFQTAYGPQIPGITQFMDKLAHARFKIVMQVINDGLDSGELRGGQPASLALIFCCIMDQHINVFSRMPDPQNYLTKKLADELVASFLHGLGAGRRGLVALPASPA